MGLLHLAAITMSVSSYSDHHSSNRHKHYASTKSISTITLHLLIKTFKFQVQETLAHGDFVRGLIHTSVSLRPYNRQLSSTNAVLRMPYSTILCKVSAACFNTAKPADFEHSPNTGAQSWAKVVYWPWHKVRVSLSQLGTSTHHNWLKHEFDRAQCVVFCNFLAILLVISNVKLPRVRM